MRFGYRRLTAMLVGEGIELNHKRVYRLYREEGLVMRMRQRRRIRWNGTAISPAAAKPNQRWSIDFVSDCVSTGRVIRMLTMVDDCTRECPTIEVDTSLGGLRVRRVLDRVAAERGLPEAIILDNGPEFRGRALAAWAKNAGCGCNSFSRVSRVRVVDDQPSVPHTGTRSRISILKSLTIYASKRMICSHSRMPYRNEV